MIKAHRLQIYSQNVYDNLIMQVYGKWKKGQEKEEVLDFELEF